MDLFKLGVICLAIITCVSILCDSIKLCCFYMAKAKASEAFKLDKNLKEEE